jgi:hypothetical protein
MANPTLFAETKPNRCGEIKGENAGDANFFSRLSFSAIAVRMFTGSLDSTVNVTTNLPVLAGSKKHIFQYTLSVPAILVEFRQIFLCSAGSSVLPDLLDLCPY